MGIVNPRPPLRAGGNRLIRVRLARHKVLTDQYIAGGMDSKAASSRAYAEVLREIPNVEAARRLEKQS
jgi:hypothetical protein